MNAETIDESVIISRFAEVATLAGIKGSIEQEGTRFEACFSLKNDRSQMVFARAIRTPAGPGVCVYSPAAEYKKGVFGGLSKDAAIDLLKRNDNLIFARYGIDDTDGSLYVVASVDLLINSLDPEELESAVWSVASAADTWEEASGQGDDY